MAKVALDKNGLAKSAGTLTVYDFDAVSGEFTGSSNEFLAKGVGLPANATLIEPPANAANLVAIYRDDKWTTVADHRGETVYTIPDGSMIVIDTLGPYPANVTPLKPSTIFDKWDGFEWVVNSDEVALQKVNDAEKKQAELLNEAVVITQLWQVQLMLDIISDSDKLKLKEWMKYIQNLQGVDVKNPLKILWPDRPV